jgi:tetratricopeptide (TPR) repeat protein
VSEHKRGTRGGIATGKIGSFPHAKSGDSGRLLAAAVKRPRGSRRAAERAQRLWESRDEILLDVPLQAQSVERLSKRERSRYRKSLALLAAEGSVVAFLRTGNMHLAGLGVYEALLTQGWKIRFNNPEEMIRLHQAAVELAESFDPRGYGKKRIAHLQARAWGELANAHRVGDRLRSSARAFEKAFALFQEGTGDPYLKARLLDLECSLHGARREFALALGQLETLSNLYRDLGEPHLAGRSLIIRALYTSYSGRPHDAIQINNDGLELIDRQRDPALFMHAIHNHLFFLVDLGRCAQAKRSLFENRRNLIYKERISALRLRGLEGRISYGLGELMSAEIAYREVREGLAEVGKSFYGAIISLELAMVLVGQKRFEEAEKEVLVAQEVFLSLEVFREFLGTIIYLHESIQQREATPELIEVAVAHLRRRELQIAPRHQR